MNRQFFRIFTVLLAAVSLTAQTTPVASHTFLGFTAEGTAAQKALESRFDAGLNPDNLRTWMKRLSARPQHLGSPYNKDNAEFIASLFRSWGYDTEIEQFDVLFPTPKSRLVEMTLPEKIHPETCGTRGRG
jgi:N-acetylated-alpha-linked acidic dipeptidase